jgi:MRC1-like domain
MATTTDSASQPFDLDAILREFNVENVHSPSVPKEDELAVSRVRESLGLGRSLFRRKTAPVETNNPESEVVDNTSSRLDEESIVQSVRPKKRILTSDDEGDLPIIKPHQHRSSSVVSDNHSDDGRMSTKSVTTPQSPLSDDDLPNVQDILADLRKARLEALSAKAAAKSRPIAEEEDAAESDRSQSHIASMIDSPRRKPKKPRKAGKKALDEMNRETQRMARNMALKPEVNVTKKIDMSSVFAKFGFRPEGPKEEKAEAENETAKIEDKSADVVRRPLRETPIKIPTHKPTPKVTLDLDPSDSDDSLPSPSKIFSSLYAQPTSSPPRRSFPPPTVTIDPSSDSDVEILPPGPRSLSVITPDRHRQKHAALFRTLANVRSPLHKTPGRVTPRELDEMLSREAAVQTARKRAERRAELKSLGIDIERIVEKRDLLEEAREEERRIREEEGGEESDEEFLDEGDADTEDNDGDSDESEDVEESDVEEGDRDEVVGSEDEEVVPDVAPKKKRRIVQIVSDDEEKIGSQPNLTVEGPVESKRSEPRGLSGYKAIDDTSLSQFFVETQMSAASAGVDSPRQSLSGAPGTGLTQFFTSTAKDDDFGTDDNAAHIRMNQLRQVSSPLRDILGTANKPFLPDQSHAQSPPANSSSSPLGRRILKRRKLPKNRRDVVDTTFEEFQQYKKQLVEEQAEESEDEFAAWRSGDESDHSEDQNAVVEGLIDDDTKINSARTERELAKLYMFEPGGGWLMVGRRIGSRMRSLSRG